MMRRIAVLDAPTNLGLRPPTADLGARAAPRRPGALRDHGLLARLRRPRRRLPHPAPVRPGRLAARRRGLPRAARSPRTRWPLADRIGAIIDGGEFPLVLGGDCSIAARLGAGHAPARRGRRRPDRAGLRGRPLRLPAPRQRLLRRRGGRRGPGPGHRAGAGRPGRASRGAGPTSGTSTWWCSASARRTSTGSTCRPPGSPPGRCRRCAPRAPPGPPSGRASSSPTAPATGCTSTWTCSTRR